MRNFIFIFTLVCSLTANVYAKDLGSKHNYKIEMITNSGKMLYSPNKLDIHLGDSVTFVLVSGAPHTVTFYPDKVPGKTSAEKKDLAEKLSYKKHYGFFQEKGEKYIIHFNNMPKGKYNFYCIPHVGMGMTGVINVN